MKRRDFLKTTGSAILGLAALTLGCGAASTATQPAPAQAAQASTNEGASQNMNTSKKVLIAYFSYSGNTKAVAEEIHKQIGGDLIEIVPATPYSETYNVCVAKAKAEQVANARPAISTQIADFDQYDTVYLGYPNWWYDMPRVIYSFFKEYDFKGKTIIPFVTYGSSRFSKSVEHIRALEPGAAVLEGPAVKDADMALSEKKVSSWLLKYGLYKN